MVTPGLGSALHLEQVLVCLGEHITHTRQNPGPHRERSIAAVCKSFNMIPANDLSTRAWWTITKIRLQFDPLHVLMTMMTTTSIPGASKNRFIYFGGFQFHPLRWFLYTVGLCLSIDDDLTGVRRVGRYIFFAFAQSSVCSYCTSSRVSE